MHGRRMYKTWCKNCENKNTPLGDEPCLSCKPNNWKGKYPMKV